MTPTLVTAGGALRWRCAHPTRLRSPVVGRNKNSQPGSARLGACSCTAVRLAVVVQVELVGMRAQPELIEFVLALPVDPGGDQVFGEDVALEQVFMILFQ